MRKLLFIYLFILVVNISYSQDKVYEFTIDLYESPKKENVTFNDLIFIESRVYKFSSPEVLELMTGTKGMAFKFTDNLYKELNIELAVRCHETESKAFIGQLKLTSGKNYFEISPWNKLEYLEKNNEGTIYVFNTYDEMKYWITAFIKIKTN